MSCRSIALLCLLWLSLREPLRAEGTPAPTNDVAFAAELAGAGQHDAAAVEYRRLAMESTQPDNAAGYYWAAAYQYAATNERVRAEAMLERAETASANITPAALLLRADMAKQNGDRPSARFYYESLLEQKTVAALLRESTQRKLAGLALEDGDLAAAHINDLPDTGARLAAAAAIGHYEAGHDKSPTVGGTLGLIPGLGHMYAGEVANGFRCMILNSIFIYGMSDSADKGNWGAFSVITFFELTWYSGSIYGGRDAVERYNRDRLIDAVTEIEGPSEPKPDLLKLPLLEFTF